MNKDDLIINLMSITSNNLDDLFKNGFDSYNVDFVIGKFLGYLDALTFLGFEDKVCKELYQKFNTELLKRILYLEGENYDK